MKITYSDGRWVGPEQSRAISTLKIVAVIFSSILLLAVVFRLVGSLLYSPPQYNSIFLVGGLVLGYLAADLVTGTVHWFCDSFFSEDTPLIGKGPIKPFRDHHVYPQRITRYRFYEQDTTSFFILGPILAWNMISGAAPNGPWMFLNQGFLIGISIGLFGTNFFHRWAHQRDVHPAVRWLQRNGLILGPRHHGLHHRNHDKGYCVTSGWLNAALDKAKVFRRLEALVRYARECVARSWDRHDR